MIFYFSGTGNSLQVAQSLSRALHEPVFAMAEAVAGGKSFDVEPDESVGLVFPTYGWDLPAVVRQFISLLHLQGDHYIYFVTTCGDDTGRLWQRAAQALEAAGAHLDSAWAVRAPNTYVCFPFFDTDPEAVVRQKLQAMPARIARIAEAIGQRRTGTFDTRPGACAWLKTYVLGRAFRRFLMSDRPFRATDACTTCGLCQKTCPMHNIRISSRRPQWHGHCTMCLSCYHHCPFHAIEYGRFTRGKGQYLLKKHMGGKSL